MAHILVVDDDDIVAELASEILMSDGHVCSFVSDTEEAWRLFRWRRPDLLMLDEAIPGGAALTFLRRLRTSPEFYDLPVIICTGATGPDRRRRAQHLGVQGFIRKPVHPRLLIWRVNQVLAAISHTPPHHALDARAEFQLRTHRGGAPRKVFL
jgi:two-component system phosphate regulon response regulator PhoB